MSPVRTVRGLTTTRPADEPSPRSRAEEFALLVEAVEDYAIFLLGPGGEIRSWNRGATRITGYEENEAVGRHFSIFYGPEDRAARKPERELEVAAREGRIEDEGWRIRRDGSRFWTNTVITALREDNGEIYGFAKVTRDMTARMQADQQLRESREIFQMLVSSVRDYAIFMIDPEGYVETWNIGAQRIKGYSAEEIIGRHFSTFYTEEDIREGKPQRGLEIARQEGSVEAEGWRVRKDGTRFWANVIITAVRDSSGELRGFAKVTRDITDRKRAEEMRQALFEQRTATLKAEEERRIAEASYRIAHEANRAKDEFLMTLSHELRTPMTAIIGWTRMLPSMSPGDPLFQEAVAAIAAGAQLQARLIDDILDVSRIMSGKLRLAPERVEVGKVITNAVDAVAATATAKGITLTKSLDPNLGSLVIDETRIQQVIWNLVSNAVKFTPHGGTVRVVARRSDSDVQIEVRDSGEGIDPEILPRIFEPFWQVESPQTRVHGGLGLGLSIVRYLAEAHGGNVSAHSEGLGKGSTFTVTLPVTQVSEDQSESAPGTPTLHGRLGGIEIVLVDDDHATRTMVAAALRNAGASVVALSSALDALNAIEQRLPNAVITDIAMPVIDGYTFARNVREREGGASIRIIALSAMFSAEADRSMFDAYITKPVDPFQLVEQVAAVVVK